MIFFTDIDDTLMKTKRKIQFQNNCIIGAFSESGDVLSLISPERSCLIDLISNYKVIPVTARSKDALSRVQLSFNAEKIINFGATILDEKNEVNLTWKDLILKNQLDLNVLSSYKIIKQELILPDNFKPIERFDDEILVFLNYRNENISLSENITTKLKIEEFLIQHNLPFYIYMTDRDLTLIPKYIKKELALEFVMKNYEGETTIGIGDHKNDFSFMSLCDFSIIPNDSSLSKLIKEIK